jgi:hypothetical protein
MSIRQTFFELTEGGVQLFSCMRRKGTNFIFEEVLETTGNREMELGFDISRVGEKK